MRVRGEGPMTPGTMMLVGEGPGAEESKTGRPFCSWAPAGSEITRYFNGDRLPDRSEVYITNLIKEWSGGSLKKKQDVTPDDITRDEWELLLELSAVQPKIVVTLGLHSTRWFLGPWATMDACHGILFKPSFTVEGQAVYVLPVYHPAAGLHQPEMAARTAYDLAVLASVLEAFESATVLPFDVLDSLCWKPAGKKEYLYGVNGLSLITNVELGFDTEGYPDKPHGWSIGTVDAGRFMHSTNVNNTFLRAVLDCPPYEVYCHNLQWEYRMLRAMGVEPDEQRMHCTQVMAYLLGVEPQALKDLALRHLGMEMTEFADIAITEEVQFSAKTGKPLKKTKKVVKPLEEIPLEVMTPYAAADAVATLGVKRALWPRIVSQGLEAIYHIDRAVLPLYARMEDVGLPIDQDHFKAFSNFLHEELAQKTAELQQEYPGVNPGNPDDVAQILFDFLGLPGAKKTSKKGRYSTNDKVLQSLKGQHPFVDAILDWRELQKLKTAFVDKLPSFLGPDGRLHYRVLPTRVVSGRLAAKDPNVLAFPKHSALGKRFRGGIRAGTGRLLGSWDLSQIELRVLAVDSQSTVLCNSFIDGLDLHARTAYKIFGVPPEHQGKSLHRLPAKTCNFSIIMGTTGIGLAEQMRKNGYPWPELSGWTAGDDKSQKAVYAAQAEVCTSWINTVLDDWDIRGYIKQAHWEARTRGWVGSMGGRRRWLPLAASSQKQVREEAMRQAQAFKPQAGARWVMKQIEARVWQEVIKPLWKEGVYIEPLWDIHDDLGMEFQADLAPMLLPVVKSVFESTIDWPIPVMAEGTVGERWSDL